MNTKNNTRLTKEDRTAIIDRMRSDIRKNNKYGLAHLLEKCAMNMEQLEAWICMIDYVTMWGRNVITVPLSDILQGEIPGTEGTSVTLKHFTKNSACYYYMALNYDGNVYDAEVEELSLITSEVSSLAEINGLPVDYTLQSLPLHSALVQLLTEAGIVEEERKRWE